VHCAGIKCYYHRETRYLEINGTIVHVGSLEKSLKTICEFTKTNFVIQLVLFNSFVSIFDIILDKMIKSYMIINTRAHGYCND